MFDEEDEKLDLKVEEPTTLFEINRTNANEVDKAGGLLRFGTDCVDTLAVSNCPRHGFRCVDGMYEPKIIILKRQEYTLRLRFKVTKRVSSDTIICRLKEVNSKGSTIFMLSIEPVGRKRMKLILKQEVFRDNIEDDEKRGVVTDQEQMLIHELWRFDKMEEVTYMLHFRVSDREGMLYSHVNGDFIHNVIDATSTASAIPCSFNFGAMSIKEGPFTIFFEEFHLWNGFYSPLLEWQDKDPEKCIWKAANQDWKEKQLGFVSLHGIIYKIFLPQDGTDDSGILYLNNRAYFIEF